MTRYLLPLFVVLVCLLVTSQTTFAQHTTMPVTSHHTDKASSSDSNSKGSSGPSSSSDGSSKSSSKNPPPSSQLNDCPSGQVPSMNGCETNPVNPNCPTGNCPATNPPPTNPPSGSCQPGQSMQADGQCVGDNIEACTIGQVDTTLGQSCQFCSDGFTTVANLSDCPPSPPPPTSSGGSSSGGSHSGSKSSSSGVASELSTNNETKVIIGCFNAAYDNISLTYTTELGKTVANPNAAQTPFNQTHPESDAVRKALVDCFQQAKHQGTTTTKHHPISIISLGQPPLLQGQIIAPPVKPAVVKNSAYMFGLHGALEDIANNATSGEPVSVLRTDLCNQGLPDTVTPKTYSDCLAGYDAALSNHKTPKPDCMAIMRQDFSDVAKGNNIAAQNDLAQVQKCLHEPVSGVNATK